MAQKPSRVLQQSLDVAQRHLGELVFRLGIEEGVLLAAEQRLVGVHAAAVLPLDRLGHERGEEAVAAGDVAHDEPEGGDVVRGGQRVGVAEVDLVLARRHLVMRRLHLEPHQLEVLHHHPADLFAPVHGAQVEVRAGVVGARGGVDPSGALSKRKNSASQPAIMV